MQKISLAAIACALLIAAHAYAASSSVEGTASCNGASPRAVVIAYYAAINQHRAANAQACLTPYFKRQAAGYVDPDWENIVYVRGLTLRIQAVPDKALPGNVPPRQALPYAATQVTARFTVRFRQVVSSPNGVTIRFIYTVKQTRNSQWRIAAIGSGP